MTRSYINGRYEIGNIFGEIIPAIPEYRYDPLANRDPILNRSVHVCEPREPIAFHYDERQQEMLLLCRCVLPSRSNFNGWLSEARKIGEVDSVVLFVCQELYRESYAFFRHHGFERHMNREKGPWFCLVGSSAKQI
jgi:hypothetical protein